jgi:hypothetical protein
VRKMEAGEVATEKEDGDAEEAAHRRIVGNQRGSSARHGQGEAPANG